MKKKNTEDCEMRLSFFLEESGMTNSDLARLVGGSRQLVNNWINREGVWVICTPKHEIKRIEKRGTKLLWGIS
jgi:hypothetical protein